MKYIQSVTPYCPVVFNDLLFKYCEILDYHKNLLQDKKIKKKTQSNTFTTQNIVHLKKTKKKTTLPECALVYKHAIAV